MLKKIIKKWLGIDKIEAEMRNINNDILGIMDKQLDNILGEKIAKVQVEEIENVKTKSGSKTRKLRKHGRGGQVKVAERRSYHEE